MGDVYMSATEVIKGILKDKNVTQVELAERTNVTKQNLSNKMNRDNFSTLELVEIADALEKKTGIKLDKRKIVISDAIKNVGTYTVTCKLGYEITAPLTVKIEEA